MTPTIRFQRVGDHALAVPSYYSDDAAGMDLPSNGQFIIAPGEQVKIPTGWAVEIPRGFEGTVRPRSGLSTNRRLKVTLGTIDSDYRGEIAVVLTNESENIEPILVGDRVAQLVISPVARCKIELAVVLSETRRGSSGWGSSGK